MSATQCHPPYSPPCATSSVEANAQAIKFRGSNNPFSNFYLSNITVWNMHFRTNEHAYQYRKALEMGQHITAENIRKARTPREAQLIAEKIPTDTRWADMKQSIMYFLLQEKASQCLPFRSELQASSGKMLVEDTSHEFWGRGKSGTGLNMLGRLLITLRENMPDFLNSPQYTHVSAQSRFPSKNVTTQPRYSSYDKTHLGDHQSRCYNCGERSHNVNTCRHSYPLQCYSCKGYGHKQKFCLYKMSQTDQK
jgi:ribA/ribD-fused uncharacterized protein